MSIEDANQAALDERLRKLLGALDAGPGFEKRVMQRVAKVAARAGAPCEDLRAQFERCRELLHRRLRREARMNGASTLGLGACAGALLWRYASEIQQVATDSMQLIDPNLLIGSVLAIVGLSVWAVLRRFT
jgi:hypothetical protein